MDRDGRVGRVNGRAGLRVRLLGKGWTRQFAFGIGTLLPSNYSFVAPPPFFIHYFFALLHTGLFRFKAIDLA